MKNNKTNRKNEELNVSKDTFVRKTSKAIVAASVVGVTLLGSVTPASVAPAPKAEKILDAKTGVEVTAYELQTATDHDSIQAGTDKPLCTVYLCVGHSPICVGSYSPE